MGRKWAVVWMTCLILAGWGGAALAGFVDNGNGTVTDTDTGLVWQQATASGTYTWEGALDYCEDLSLAGHSDWRLPTIKELDSIVDLTRYSPAINKDFFPDAVAAIYWSSTSNNAYTTNYAWGVDFDRGNDERDCYKPGNANYVLALRGGQSGSLGHLVISSPKQASSWIAGSTMPIRWNTAGLGANVKISLSRQGGLDGSFETIVETTSNDGQYDWKTTGSISVNCVIKIEQGDNPANWATEGFFAIQAPANPVNPALYLLLLE